MRHDLPRLTQEEFCDKYMVARQEYNMIKFGGEERVNSFVKEMEQRAAAIEQELAADDKQETSLQRECFLVPYVPIGVTGRVIVSRDVPPKKKSSIALPKSMRKEKTLLPTTGHIIVANVWRDNDERGLREVSSEYIGMRVLFGQMSGSAICFKGYPTWIQLEMSEIMAIVLKEDADVIEEELEPMV